MLRDTALELFHHAGARHSYQAARLHEAGETIEVEIIRAVVVEGVDGCDGVEELRRERKGPGIGVNGKHATLDARIADSVPVFRRAEPEIGRPDLYSKLAVQEN